MEIEEWCRLAQDEQISLKKGHVYANFRHSHALSLVSRPVVDNFGCGLSKIKAIDPANLEQYETGDFGLAHVAIERAVSRFHNDPRCATRNDFRVDGLMFSYNNILVSLGYRPAPAIVTATGHLPTAAPYKPSPTLPVNIPPRVVWLTRPEYVTHAIESHLKMLGKSKLSETQFFSIMVSLLGLRPRGLMTGQADCTLFAFKVKPTKSLSRPHVFSQGYPERFCGVSPFGKFGSTADNRNGLAGLPEALSYETDLIKLDRSDADLSSFINQLALFVNFSPIVLQSLSGRFQMSDLHAQDDPVEARRTILHRMRRVQPNKFCNELPTANRICTSAGKCCV